MAVSWLINGGDPNHILTGMIIQVDGGFKYFLILPLPGEMIQFDVHIFQMGWFNHHLVFYDHLAEQPPAVCGKG